MPGEFNPARGWTGTANHDTRPAAYPYTYSTYFAPSYRYRRLTQLLDANASVSSEDNWQYMHDTKNLQAARMAPILEPLLRASGFTGFADLLAGWSHVDAAEDRAPLVYQLLYQELARATFEDDLGEALTEEMLGSWYFWQERFDQLVARGDSHWFDDARTTENVEGLPDVVATAAASAETRLAALGAGAVWGDVHRIRFTSPIRRAGFGSDWLGGGDYPMSGSGETLYRARYGFNQPFDTAFFASYKFVSDMARGDTIMTALPGGVAARVLHKHYRDQIPSWHAGKATDTPLTRDAAMAAAVSTLVLLPQN
jgi:penicillin amidase